MNTNSSPQERAASKWAPIAAWGAAIAMMALMVFLLVTRTTIVEAIAPAATPTAIPTIAVEAAAEPAPLPYLDVNQPVNAITREIDTHTIIPNRLRTGVLEYTIDTGDAIFGVANKYNITPETVLWANYDQLNDNPDMISVGMTLVIPPVDGVYYQWQEGDTIESVADEFDADPQDILNFPGNKLDLTEPVIEPESYVMIPGGHREFRQWLVPTIWAANSGASQSIAGPGACTLSGGGAMGSGAFVWPADNHYLSGNDYWSGHLGIDIATASTAPIYAADSGTVVYSGSIGGGYGIMIMIDHGNGYHTLYAHLNNTLVYCGQSVSRGQMIGNAGSTGNSTGPHLHFEVRYNGGFINPWYVLP